MNGGLSRQNIKKQLDEISEQHSKEDTITIVSALLKDEYGRLDDAMGKARSAYLKLRVDDPALQNEIADLRLDAVESYHKAYAIESFLADLDVDITGMMPEYAGNFEISSAGEKNWDLTAVSIKENAMRTLGGHCNVVGDIIVLDRLLYDHTYLASVMKVSDDYKPGDMPASIEFDFYTVVFDEEITATVKMSIPAV
jgi:hypothetical protein